jgi:hypothetical protein
MIYKLSDLIGPSDARTDVNGTWVRLVPVAFAPGFFGKLHGAWGVLTGTACAVRWPQPGELEKALSDPCSVDSLT